MSLQIKLVEYYVQQIQMKKQQLQQMLQQQQAAQLGKQHNVSSGFAAGYMLTRKEQYEETEAPLTKDVEQTFKLSDFVFAVGLGELSADPEVFSFGDLEQFAISLEVAFRSKVSSLEFIVFAKAADDSFDFVPIHSMILNRYVLSKDTALIITESVDIPSADASRRRSGILLIQCSSDIIIGPKVIIDGSGSKVSGEGGEIRMISDGKITNEGTLCCNGSGDGEGGKIYIVADTFVNDGRIDCTPNGQIYIYCREFIDNGVVSPEPVEAESHKDAGSPFSRFIDYLMQTLKSEADLIEDADAFLNSVGVRPEPSWFQYIADHRQLFERSKLGTRIVIDRIADELKLDFFAFLRGVVSGISLDRNQNVILNEESGPSESAAGSTQKIPEMMDMIRRSLVKHKDRAIVQGVYGVKCRDDYEGLMERIREMESTYYDKMNAELSVKAREMEQRLSDEKRALKEQYEASIANDPNMANKYALRMEIARLQDKLEQYQLKTFDGEQKKIELSDQLEEVQGQKWQIEWKMEDHEFENQKLQKKLEMTTQQMRLMEVQRIRSEQDRVGRGHHRRSTEEWNVMVQKLREDKDAQEEQFEEEFREYEHMANQKVVCDNVFVNERQSRLVARQCLCRSLWRSTTYNIFK